MPLPGSLKKISGLILPLQSDLSMKLQKKLIEMSMGHLQVGGHVRFDVSPDDERRKRAAPPAEVG